MTKPLSVLGFGCAPVMGKVGKSKALRAMSIATDCGISHFDIARSYGFGAAEEVLGSFIAGRRSAVTITTKFGVVPPDIGPLAQRMIPLVRAVSGRLPFLRKSVTRTSGALLANRNYSKAYGQVCLEASLRALRTDYVDYLLLHEPDQTSVQQPELFEWLQRLVQEGKVRQWGWALGHPRDSTWARELPAGHVVQYEGNLSTAAACSPEWAKERTDGRLQFVTRPFAGGTAGQLAAIDCAVKNLKVEEELRSAGVGSSEIALSLASALAGNNGLVICSMFDPAHIKRNVASIDLARRTPALQRVVQYLLRQSQSQHEYVQ